MSPTITGEIVHDLRSALDHLAWQFVEYVNPGGATENTNWPLMAVGPTPNKKGVHGPIVITGGVSPTALALIERTQPYITDPTDPHFAPLRLLHRMWIRDKHCKIALHGVQAHISQRGEWTAPTFRWTSELITADEYSATLRLVPDDPEVDVTGTLTISIVVKEAPSGEASPLLSTLDDACRIVREVLVEAEATCFS